MLEPLNPQEGHDRPALGREPAGADAAKPVADREVPLPGTELGATPAAVHAWLDGEGTEGDARLADPRQAALWSRIAEETAARRRLTTPAHVAAQIMQAIPATAPAPAATASMATASAASEPVSARRATAATVAESAGGITLSPAAALAAAAGLIALGFLAARLLG
jgi:hypothetical protein